jgi:hypothetical protein
MTTPAERIEDPPFPPAVDKLWVDRPSLEAKVLGWLRRHHEGAQFEVTAVTGVVPFGTDGPPNEPTFELRLTYTTTDPNRPTLHLIVEGSDMESLWRHVVGGDA